MDEMPAHDKTRPNAYEIPTWAIANAIRRRPQKAKVVVRDDAKTPLPQMPGDAAHVAVIARDSGAITASESSAE